MSHIFISYSHHDTDYINRLAQTFADHQLQYWYDDRINPGDRWAEEIIDNIKKAAAFVVVMTPAANEARWVQREIRVAFESQKRIFPLLLADKSFPILSDYQYENVTHGRMPSNRFYDTLKTVVGRIFSTDILAFGETWMHHLGYEPQSRNEILETQLCTAIGFKANPLDLKFMAVIKSDGMSVAEIHETHKAFHRYIGQWRPASPLQRLLKKHGAISFVFEHGHPEGLPTRLDSEANRLAVTDAVRTEMWYVDFVAKTITTDERPGFPPVVSPYIDERKRLETFLTTYFDG